MKLSKRALAVIGAGVACVVFGGTPARAAYPDRSLTAVIPFTVGGLSDVAGRLIATFLSKKMGQTIIVENKPGAGGNIGIQYALRAKPDGYTILLSSIAMTTNPALYQHLSWDPAKVQPVALTGFIPDVVGVNTKRFPAGNLMDLVAEIKKNPGKFNFGSSDSTTAENLFALVTGTKIEIVNYPGAGDGATSLMSGETDVATTASSVLIPLVSSGKIRILAVTGEKRLAALPDVPTTTEAGLPDFQPINYFGVYVPKGTPADVVAALNKAVNETMADPDVISRLAVLGATANQSTVQQASDFYEKDIQTWKDVVAKAKIPPLD